MRACGVALGVVLAMLFVLRRGYGGAVEARPTPKPPAVLSAAAVADDAGPLREVLLHYVPEVEPSFRPAYRDFLLSLAPETRVTMVVRRQDRARLEAFLTRLDAGGGLSRRVRVVEIGRPLGIWSKDRALVLASAGGDGGSAKIELVVPPRTRPGEGSRPSDWDIVPAVVTALPGELELRQLPIAFDAGDFAITKSRVVFDVNLFARNRARGFRNPQELRDEVRTLLGRDVLMLGTEVGDVPRHHMSMYMALLDGNVALVGDPAAGEKLVGRDYVPGETSPETGEPLRADFSAAMKARFERAAGDLAAAGFRVVRIPTVPFDDKTYFAYTNGIYETRAGRRTAWVPTFGGNASALDDAARAVYEGLGWNVVPVDVRALYPQHGTIGCVVNVLSRGAGGGAGE